MNPAERAFQSLINAYTALGGNPEDIIEDALNAEAPQVEQRKPEDPLADTLRMRSLGVKWN